MPLSEAEKKLKGFGKRLRAARISAGYETAKGFAEMLGIEPPRYRQYERGAAMPPIDLLEKVCQSVDKTSDFLLFGARSGGVPKQGTSE